MEYEKMEQLGRQIGFQFLPAFDQMTTSDLQACIDAEVAKQGFTGSEAMIIGEEALTYIYGKVSTRKK